MLIGVKTTSFISNRKLLWSMDIKRTLKKFSYTSISEYYNYLFFFYFFSHRLLCACHFGIHFYNEYATKKRHNNIRSMIVGQMHSKLCQSNNFMRLNALIWTFINSKNAFLTMMNSNKKKICTIINNKSKEKAKATLAMTDYRRKI